MRSTICLMVNGVARSEETSVNQGISACDSRCSAMMSLKRLHGGLLAAILVILAPRLRADAAALTPPLWRTRRPHSSSGRFNECNCRRCDGASGWFTAAPAPIGPAEALQDLGQSSDTGAWIA